MEEFNRNISKVVSTSSIVISEQQAGGTSERTFIAISNLGTEPVFLAIGAISQLNSGVSISAGGVYAESQDSGFKPTQERIEAISSGAGATLAISERIKYK
jgi:hypothetical protein